MISIKEKKGQLFTILGIMLILLMFLSLDIYSSIRDKNVIKTRVKTMDNFLNSMEKNLERQLYISGFRIILLAENQMTITGDYILDRDYFFNEAFFNGTVNGIPQEIMYEALSDNITSSVNAKASKINVEVTITHTNLSVSQEDPWNVKFTIESEFLMRDRQNLAQWNKIQKVSAYVPIEKFFDPVFLVNTKNKLTPLKINQTPYEGNYVSGVDYSNLIDHVNKGYFAANPAAPSFLNRIEGNLSSDPNGIETFVNVPKLSTIALEKDKTVVDYIYFSNDNPTYISVPEVNSWFKIDNNHKPKYNITT